MEIKRKDLLTALFAGLLVLSNILSVKLISIGPLLVPGGIVCYAITFLISDVINECYGKESGKCAVYVGFTVQLICSVLIALTVLLPSIDTEVSLAFSKVMNVSFWSVLASLVSFILASTIDLYIFHILRNRLPDKWKWVWNNVSTIVGQTIDTVIYVFIAFGIGYGFLFEGSTQVLLQMCLSQISLKIVLALLDTPFFYLLTKDSKKLKSMR